MNQIYRACLSKRQHALAFAVIHTQRHDFDGNWNYIIWPLPQ
jgi:hypothetical protein